MPKEGVEFAARALLARRKISKNKARSLMITPPFYYTTRIIILRLSSKFNKIIRTVPFIYSNLFPTLSRCPAINSAAFIMRLPPGCISLMISSPLPVATIMPSLETSTISPGFPVP